ncbi:MAG TPA: sulfatase-like hydrolase/transferase [Vicinamibacterales bacterium]|nr:sulfatase-like hydrolase/transferase [Vicinamibacterales bacterium]
MGGESPVLIRRTILVIGFAALALAGAGAPAKPDILLVTLDTTRADRMGFLGSARGLTPALDAWSRTATVFTRAYAQAPVTTVSHATILTGTFPPFHRVRDFGAPLGPDVPYLPQVLHDAGYATAAFVGAIVLDPRTGTAPGFARGFDLYDAGFRLRRPGEDRYSTIERRASEVVARAMRWIETKSSGPWFAWVHVFDPHDPYDPPSDLKKRFGAAPYDGEIAAVDRAIGALLRAAPTSAIVAVAADHGESLGDHGEDSHGMFLYEAALHVPLVVRTPNVGVGARVTRRVRLADLAPTLLEAAAIPVPRTMQGQSLLSVTTDRPVFSETEYPQRAFGWSPLVSWRADRFLYIRAPKPELYDLVADPDARRNLAADRPRVLDGIGKELEEFERQHRSGGAQGRVDPDLAARLAALGYVGGSMPPPATGVDPKDRIALANALHAAELAVDDGAFQRAIPLLEQVVASEPNVKLAQLQLGVSRAHQKQYARAVEPLARAVALDPDDTFARYELGVARYETGNLRSAAADFEIVARRLPEWADARYSLGSVWARIDRVSDAIRELRAALQIEPRHFRANLLLGRVLTLQGHPDEALAYLRAAVAVEPANAEARQFLNDALARVKSGDSFAR